MNKPAAKTATTSSAAKPGATTAAADAAGTLVHAYRRQPHMKDTGNGVMAEQDVVVEALGEKVKFRSNEAGHVVGTVKTAALLERLVKGIPEAYMVYDGGENIPAPKKEVGNVRPEGAFVLESNTTEGVQYVVLDDMSDEDLREFAAEAGLEDEQTPEALKGESLRQAIYNLLATSK